MCLIFPCLSFASYSASYNCNMKNLSNIEKQICSSKNLSRMDEALSNLYIALNDSYITDIDKSQLQETQKTWLHSRNQCNSNKCITTAYQNRIHKLSDKLKIVNRLQTKKHLLKLFHNVTGNIHKSKYSIKVEINPIFNKSYIKNDLSHHLFIAHVGGGIGSGPCSGGFVTYIVYATNEISSGKIIESKRIYKDGCRGTHSIGLDIPAAPIYQGQGNKSYTAYFVSESKKKVTAFTITYPIDWKGHIYSRKYSGIPNFIMNDQREYQVY